MKKNYTTQFLVKFYKFTHFVENFVPKVINFLQKEKKEFSNIINAAWVEHQIGDLLKISIFLVLILWIMFQSYYYGGTFYISYDSYLQLKKLLLSLNQTNQQYLNAIQVQNDDIETMSHLLQKCRKYGADPVTASMLLFIGTMTGLVIGSFITVITMSK